MLLLLMGHQPVPLLFKDAVWPNSPYSCFLIKLQLVFLFKLLIFNIYGVFLILSLKQDFSFQSRLDLLNELYSAFQHELLYKSGLWRVIFSNYANKGCDQTRFLGSWSSPNLLFSKLREITQWEIVVHHNSTTWCRYLLCTPLEVKWPRRGVH